MYVSKCSCNNDGFVHSVRMSHGVEMPCVMPFSSFLFRPFTFCIVLESAQCTQRVCVYNQQQQQQFLNTLSFVLRFVDRLECIRQCVHGCFSYFKMSFTITFLYFCKHFSLCHLLLYIFDQLIFFSFNAFYLSSSMCHCPLGSYNFRLENKKVISYSLSKAVRTATIGRIHDSAQLFSSILIYFFVAWYFLLLFSEYPIFYYFVFDSIWYASCILFRLFYRLFIVSE